MLTKRIVGIIGASCAFLLLCTVARGEVIDRVVAVVGPDIVTLSELEEFSQQLPQMTKEEVLNVLIEDLLIEQEAKRIGITVSDAEVEASIQARMAQFNMSEQEFARTLVEQGMSIEEFKEKLRSRIMKMKFVQHEVRGGIDVSDEEVLNFYKLHQDDFRAGKEVHLAHIFLPFPLSEDVEQQEKVRKLAAELKQKIDGGTDFADLAKKYSRSNPDGGGDIGWLKYGDMNPAFVGAIKDLNPGQTTDPFESDTGVHILKIIEIKESEVVPFEQVKDRIADYLYDIKLQEQLNRLVDEIKERTPIEIKL